MSVEIKNRFTGQTICTGETIRDAVIRNLKSLGGADLRDAYLRGADLGGAYLRGADLRDADLRDADLRDAYLRGADLRGADLRDADLGGAYLRGADLGGADLRGADLGDADLRDADLRGAYLRGAYLRGAYLRDAYLIGADLSDADLRGAYLIGAYLRDADLKMKVAWSSHDLIAEILRRAAGDDIAKLKIAGLVLVCREKCWDAFLKMDDPLSGWALGVLAEWVQDGDGAPDVLRQMVVPTPPAEQAEGGR